MDIYLKLILALCMIAPNFAQWRPCVELKRDLHVPCECKIPLKRPKTIEMKCDRVVFSRDTAKELRGQPIVAFSQRNAGYRNLPEDVINFIPSLEELDLSENLIYRLMDRILQGQSRIKKLWLEDNFLGDSLNPIFSSNEFHGMSNLVLLNINRNGIKSIEEGMFKGCINLQELYLANNNLTSIPTKSLKGPTSLAILSLAGNNIVSLPRGAFSTLESLFKLDLSHNGLSHMEDGALIGMENLLYLNIAHNDLSRFNSDVFKGAYNLRELDLAANFLHEFPTDALRHLDELKFLNISDNLITEIQQTHLSSMKKLQVLDLSRNNIGRLGINAFSSLSALIKLDLSLNSLRTIEESAFEGLTKLEWLSLEDNNILLIPSTALARLPSLTHLQLEFNRVAAISTELIRSIAPNLLVLGLNRNLVREIPARLFHNFERLVSIELSGNILSLITSHTFAGLEDTLLSLDLSNNRLTSIGENLPLKNLLYLNLSGNQLKRISPEIFLHLTNLVTLNLRNNPLYGGFPPIFPQTLRKLDVSYTGLKILPAILFLNLHSLEQISLAGNKLKEIHENTFQHLYNLTSIDLSDNRIEQIDRSAFVGAINLYKLNLKGNKLTSFVGEHFNTGTNLQILDLSDNLINQLSPTSFVIHPRLKDLNLAGNQFTQFPSDFVKTLQFLEKLNLSRNMLHIIDEFGFSQMARLRILELSGNLIESVDELAFHNSTQLQIIDLSNNKLESLSERAMEGVLRLEYLNLGNNKLASLSETIFDPSRIRSVEKINLSGNRFTEIPTRTLQKQSSSLYSLNMAKNKLVEVFSQDIVGNVKNLDLSENSLSDNAVRGILGDAKILRSLNLAHTGIKNIAHLETPFLRYLNLSGNSITNIKPTALERTTMLESLDLSQNRLSDFTDMIDTFKTLPVLKSLDISSNSIKTINESSFEGLEMLRSLKMSNFSNCTRIEKSAFKTLRSKLHVLHAYDYPRLGYFDLQGILKEMKNLEELDVEMKDSVIGNEQLSIKSHPRLRKLSLRGERLRSILSSALAGIRVPNFSLGLKNTSIHAIPPTLFFPVPKSTKIELDISGSKLQTITPQLITALDERAGSIELRGLDSINCDCEAKNLWRWLKSITSLSKPISEPIKCKTPDYVAGKILNELSEEHLSCDQVTKKIETTETTTSVRSTTFEPEIIWTVAPTIQENRNKHYNGDSPVNPIINSAGTDDTLIISIVGGVVAFIAIVIIIICICRLRWSSQMNDAHMAAAMASSIHEASMIRPGSVAYSGKMGNQELYVGSYNGSTLGHGNGTHPGLSVPTTPVPMLPFVQPMQMVQSPVPPQPIYGYYDNQPLSMYVTCPSENKFDR